MVLPQQNLVRVMEESAGAGAALKLLKSLANLDRLTILCSLIEGEKNVGELEQLLNIRQPTLSQQLARLRQAEFVATRRVGKAIYYRIDDLNVAQVIEVLHDIYCSQNEASSISR